MFWDVITFFKITQTFLIFASLCSLLAVLLIHTFMRDTFCRNSCWLIFLSHTFLLVHPPVLLLSVYLVRVCSICYLNPYSWIYLRSCVYVCTYVCMCSYTHGRADEVKQHDEMDTGLGSDHPAVYAAGPLSDISDTQTGVRLATDSSRNGSTGDLISSHHPHPVDPWTDRQRQRRPKSSATSSKHATIAVTSANHDPESHSSGTDARNGYQGESADDNTLTARENEPFIPRKQFPDCCWDYRFRSVIIVPAWSQRIQRTDLYNDLVTCNRCSHCSLVLISSTPVSWRLSKAS